MKHHGEPVPLEVYHGVPKGWYAPEILAEHVRLRGTFDISGPEATEPGAPSWMPERRAWLQYRVTLYRIAEGLSAKDPACIELAIRYIELQYIGSYSGYVRATLCRRLKHVVLSANQKKRLHLHFRSMVLAGNRTAEFSEYIKLWRRIITRDQRSELLKKLAKKEDVAQWLVEMLDRKTINYGPPKAQQEQND